MTTAHWAAAYIGTPWIARRHDCWAFARRVWAERFGLDVPAVDVDALDARAVLRAFRDHPERGHWVEVDQPREGDGVLLSHSRHPSHVGVWIDIDGGGVLHCDRHSGVVFATHSALERCGWGSLRYYRHEANT